MTNNYISTEIILYISKMKKYCILKITGIVIIIIIKLSNIETFFTYVLMEREYWTELPFWASISIPIIVTKKNIKKKVVNKKSIDHFDYLIIYIKYKLLSI